MKIVVAGDLIWDFNLVRQPRAPARYHQQVPHTVQYGRAGGAWYLADLIRLACPDGDVDAEVVTHRRATPTLEGMGCPYSCAYSVWSRHSRFDHSADKVWRIEEFLGCEPASPDAELLPIENDVADPDLLVLEDLGLGFRDREAAWPAALRDGGAPKRITLKSSDSLPAGHLWETLRRAHLDRLTVVIPAALLRAQSRRFSQTLSWDQTIEATISEMEEGVGGQELRRCRRVILQFGEAGAASFTRCRLKFGAPPSDATARSADALVRETVTLERFLYDPDDLEGSWKARCPGHVVGSTSILTAAVVRHELDPATYPLYLALGRGLAAVRENHDVGGGSKDFSADAVEAKLSEIFHPQEGKGESAAIYYSAFPRSLLGERAKKGREAAQAEERAPSGPKSDLLADFTGWRLEYVAAKATDVVLRGAEVALAAAPKARYGAYLTVDRQEIERINAIRNLILSYQRNPEDRRPLSIAVFGPPGSGKSFAIRQLAAELFGKTQEVLEFNLSQFHRLEDLHGAFHQVRDASIRGQIPLVFWDEFDSQNLRWLKDFLAPMQDAKFRVGSVAHPLGKAIFVFAGGTSSDFESFSNPREGSPFAESFGLAKGPDFVSRLRGFVNIKGPNPAYESSDTAEGPAQPTAEPSWHKAAGEDPAHLIRRAILLRSMLEGDYAALIDESTGLASVSPGIVRGLLRVREYRHGARSLESVVSMSTLTGARQFQVDSLPSADQLNLHVTPDFLEQVQMGQLEIPLVEALAEACHEAWRKQRESKGWTYGSPRDDERLIHPLLVPYAQLLEKDKEANRLSARVVEAKLLEVGFAIEHVGASERLAVSADEFMEAAEELAEIEHDIWLRDHLLEGYEWAETTDAGLRQHRDIGPFAALGSTEQDIDRAIVCSIPEALYKAGYRLVKAG